MLLHYFEMKRKFSHIYKNNWFVDESWTYVNKNLFSYKRFNKFSNVKDYEFKNNDWNDENVDIKHKNITKTIRSTIEKNDYLRFFD